MIVQYITSYYRWGNRQRPPFTLSIRVWPSSVLRIKSSYHHHSEAVDSAILTRCKRCHRNRKPPIDLVLMDPRGAELGRSHPGRKGGRTAPCVCLTKLSRENWTLKGGIRTTTGTTEALRHAYPPPQSRREGRTLEWKRSSTDLPPPVHP